jgi:two-component system cell cycle sensor histidine kinase/response regulator CckA
MSAGREEHRFHKNITADAAVHPDEVQKTGSSLKPRVLERVDKAVILFRYLLSAFGLTKCRAAPNARYISYMNDPTAYNVDSDPGNESRAVLTLQRQLETLRYSKERLSGIIESAMDAIVTIDEEQRILVFNGAAERMFLCPADDAIGTSLERFIPEKFRGGHHAHIREFGTTGVSSRAMGATRAVFGLRTSGEEFPIEASISQVDADGQKLFTVIMRDISDRLRAEHEKERAEERFHQLIEGAPNGMVMVDHFGRILLVNAEIERLFGYVRHELIGEPIEILVPVRYHERHEGSRNAYIENPSTRPMGIGRDLYGLRKDGSEFPVEIGLNPLETSEGRVVVGTIADITERRRLEALAHRRQSQLAEAQRIAHLGTWNWDLRTNEVDWSDQLFRIFALDPKRKPLSYEELIAEVLHPDDLQMVQDAFETSFASGTLLDVTFRIVHADGAVRTIRTRGNAVAGMDGKPERMFGTCQDVTEHKLAEERQRVLNDRLENERGRLTDIVSNVPGIVWEIYFGDESAGESFVSAYVEKMLGYDAEEWLSDTQFWLKIVHPDDLEAVRKSSDKLIQGPEKEFAQEYRWITKDGRIIWAQTNIAKIFDGSGQLIGLRGATLETTDRKRAEAALVESEEKYRQLFSSSPLPMWVYDRETYDILEVNEAATRHYGYTRDEFRSMTIWDIRTEPEVLRLRETIAKIDSPFGETAMWQHRKKDGSFISVECTAHSIDFNDRPARLVLVNDVTQRRSLEDQLRQSQKMEAIGMLAGGIAHDFNNLLTAINGYSELVLRRMDADDRFRGSINEIQKAGKRAAGLTGQLLAFSRKQVLQPKLLDLNGVVSGIEEMLNRMIGEDIELRTALAPDLWSTLADPGQMDQILLNLCVNARDAMPTGGHITIETKNVNLDDDYAASHFGVKAGPYVMLAVSDTGVGMDAETQKRIYEPFFTTKALGKGTGLGLSTTFGIVQQSGGSIWVYSEPGKGSTFKVYLPKAEESGTAVVEAAVQPVDLSGTETILLAEDEEIVRGLAIEALEMYGYRVLAASSGHSALKLAAEHAAEISLLITDVVMPTMSGHELATELRKTLPDIKVLYMSGYTDNSIVHYGVLDEGVELLQKPFSTFELAQRVRALLNS